MANQNPTGSGPSVALTIPVADGDFLRSIFTMARDGIREELADYPDQLREPILLHREEATYDALLAALDGGSVVVSDDIRRVLCDLAKMIDGENEYERVVAEHAALLGFCEQVSEGARR